MVDALFVDPDTGIPYDALPVEVQNFPGTQPVSGTVALDAATLAALESIQAAVQGTVELGAATLAALETINAIVTGTVAVSNFPTSTTITGNVEVANDVGNPLPISGTVTANVGTGTQPVSGTVALDSVTLAALESISVQNFPGTQPVSGPLTDTQLRATPVPVSGTVATGGLTDTQLRAVAVPVSGTVTANVGTGTQPVSGTVAVSNFPATQTVAGSVTVSGTVRALNDLIPVAYDFLDLNYTGDDVTQVIYKTGGSGGSTVATLTLAYSVPGVLDTVTRT